MNPEGIADLIPLQKTEASSGILRNQQPLQVGIQSQGGRSTTSGPAFRLWSAKRKLWPTAERPTRTYSDARGTEVYIFLVSGNPYLLNTFIVLMHTQKDESQSVLMLLGDIINNYYILFGTNHNFWVMQHKKGEIIHLLGKLKVQEQLLFQYFQVV